MIYAVTHGQKGSGSNPQLTTIGMEEIVQLRKHIEKIDFDQIIVATGTRFLMTLESLGFSKDRVKFSPLLGSADSGEKSESGFKGLLADGTLVEIDNYIGLIGTPGINLWTWLQSLKGETLLVTGREFMFGLDVMDAVPSAVYRIDPLSQEIEKIV